MTAGAPTPDGPGCTAETDPGGRQIGSLRASLAAGSFAGLHRGGNSVERSCSRWLDRLPLEAVPLEAVLTLASPDSGNVPAMLRAALQSFGKVSIGFRRC